MLQDEGARTRLRVALALVPLAIVAYLVLSRAMRPPIGGPSGGAELPKVSLIEPRGVHRDAPPLFRWEPYSGAVSYRLTIMDQDMIWPVARRETAGTEMRFTDEERRAWAARRRYAWSVEALDDGGERVLALGEAAFAVGEPKPPDEPGP